MGEHIPLHLFLASLVLGVGVLQMLFRFRRVWSITMLDVAILMTSIFFGLGPLVAFVYAHGHLIEVDQSVLVQGYAGVLLFMFGIWIVRWVTARPAVADTEHGEALVLGRASESILRLSDVNLILVIIAWLFVWGVRFLIASKWGMLFSGTQTLERELALPYGIVVLRTMSGVLASGIIMWSGVTLFTSLTKRLPALIFVLSEGIYVFTQGRRELLLLAMSLGVAFFAVKGRLMARHVILWGLAVFFVWAIALPAFFAMRNELLNRQSGNPVVDVIDAFSNYLNSNARDLEERQYDRNLAKRPLIINFNLRIAGDQEIQGVMWGRAILASTAWSMPRFILPLTEKGEMSEQTIQRFYGMKLEDTSMNWPAAGTADFGLFGTFAYGILFGVSITVIEALTPKIGRRYPFTAACFIGVLLGLAFMVEQGPEAVWTAIRDVFVVFVAGVLIEPFVPQTAAQQEPEQQMQHQVV
jgi:hypothetical protein